MHNISRTLYNSGRADGFLWCSGATARNNVVSVARINCVFVCARARAFLLSVFILDRSLFYQYDFGFFVSSPLAWCDGRSFGCMHVNQIWLFGLKPRQTQQPRRSIPFFIHFVHIPSNARLTQWSAIERAGRTLTSEWGENLFLRKIKFQNFHATNRVEWERNYARPASAAAESDSRDARSKRFMGRQTIKSKSIRAHTHTRLVTYPRRGNSSAACPDFQPLFCRSKTTEQEHEKMPTKMLIFFRFICFFCLVAIYTTAA